MDVYQRIKLAVKWLVGNGIAANQKEVGKLLGYKNESSFSQVINGKVPLPGGFVDRLCELSSVLNPYWILEEKGDMLKKDNEAIPLSSNCIINVPKPKTHRKAGVTIALKNLVGINVRKEYLPHHRVGGSVSGIGDEYLGQSNLRKFSSYFLDLSNKMATKNYYIVAKSLLAMTLVINKIDSLFCSHHNKYAEGSWFGNDTIWRTILDLNRILMYADRNGVITDTPQRKSLCVADMVVIGEGEGPLLPSPRHVGAVAIGENYVCFDEAVATIMGMNFKLIPSIYKPRLFTKDLPIVLENDNTTIVSNNKHWDKQPLDKIKYEDTLQLLPSSGWKGHIELK